MHSRELSVRPLQVAIGMIAPRLLAGLIIGGTLAALDATLGVPVSIRVGAHLVIHPRSRG